MLPPPPFRFLYVFPLSLSTFLLKWASCKKFDKHFKHPSRAKHFNLQGVLQAVARNSRCYCHFPQGSLLLKRTIGRNFHTAPFQVSWSGALNIWKWMIVCKRTLSQRMFALSVVYLLSSVLLISLCKDNYTLNLTRNDVTTHKNF